MSESLQNKLEPVQDNVALTMTGVIRGFSKEEIYQESCIKSLKYRWCQKFDWFFKRNNLFDISFKDYYFF